MQSIPPSEMHCRIKRLLKANHKALYDLYSDACADDKLRSPCTLILPDPATVKTLAGKLDKEYNDQTLASVGNVLKALILTQPHPPPLTGSFRNVLSQDVVITDGVLDGVKLEHVATIGDEARPLFCIYQAKGPVSITGAPTPRQHDSPRQRDTGGARRVPRRRGGGDLVAAMIGKHLQLITSGSGCSPFAEAMCYQLAALQVNGADQGVLAAVRLVASYDPAVFFTSLGLDTSSPVIPSAFRTVGGSAPAANYDTVLTQFLSKGDMALAACFGTAGCDLDKVCTNIKARRQAFDGDSAIETAYTALGGFFSKCGIPLTAAQKMRADKVADLVCQSEGPDAYTAAISAPAVGLPRGERYFHMIFREEGSNTAEEVKYKSYYTASVCSAQEQDEVLSFIKSLSH